MNSMPSMYGPERLVTSLACVSDVCRSIFRVLLSSLLLLSVVSCAGEHGDDFGNGSSGHVGKGIRVGFARVDVTPDVPVKLAGYGTFFLAEESCRWSTGVHDPLFASAVVFDDPGGDGPVILVVVDVVGLMAGDIETIQRELAVATGIGKKGVIVASTHTHHSPDTIGLWGVIFPPISGRQEHVVERILAGAVQAGLDAWRTRVPAALSYAVGEESALHENIIFEDPERTIDDTMTVLAAHDEEGRLLGTLMHWACHPTVMGQESTLVSADFAGVYYRIMGEALDGVHLYLNGALGAMIQPVPRWVAPEAWDEVDLVGQGLADNAQALLAGATQIEDPAVGFLKRRVVPVALENPLFRVVAALGLLDREMPPLGGDADIFVTTFVVGPVVFATLPGELVPDYSFVLRDILGGNAQILIGLSMDWIGYILTPGQACDPAYVYEQTLCPGPGAGEALVAVYRNLYGRE